MKNIDLFEAIGQVDEELLKEADTARNTNLIKVKKWKGLKLAIAAAAVLTISIILPNTNASVAYAMSNIPVIGRYFEVITFRTYQFESDKQQADVTVPQIVIKEDDKTEKTEDKAVIEEDKKESVSKINEEIKALTDKLIADFEKEQAEKYGEGYHSMTVTHEVLVENEKWYTLKLTVLQVEASGWEENHYYTINMQTGKIAEMKDIFADDSNYKEIISENIKEQMKAQMESDDMFMYWLDQEELGADNFECITDETGFYINDKDELVICFNEGDVAPMYMGCVEFVIPKTVTDPMLK